LLQNLKDEICDELNHMKVRYSVEEYVKGSFFFGIRIDSKGNDISHGFVHHYGYAEPNSCNIGGEKRKQQLKILKRLGYENKT